MAEITLVSNTQTEFRIPVDVAKGSLLLKELIEEDPDSTEPIPLPAVGDRDLAKVIEYLKANKEEPLKFIVRPLRSDKLTDSGVPEWADKFVYDINPHELLDLADAGTAMRIKMLPYLVCARIAAEVKKLGKDGLEALYVMKKPWTEEDSRELKLQNDWAWKEEDTPVLDDEHADAAAAAAALAAAPLAPAAPAGK